jgi:MraZ protein
MFIGQYSHTLDDKNRLALPARFRADLERGVALTAGTGKNLLAYPLPEFEKLAEKVDALQLIGQEAETLRRLLFVNAAMGEMDKQGRVLLPEHLRAHAEIEKEAVVVGVGKFIEIWNPANWVQAKAEVQEAATQKHVWARLGI